ncbi:PREDICTED: pre-mRNA-splicing factor ISY1 homolog [Papilio xuthus]|uniref:Pre-mRNA-splicing factor ISY1 homolog n=1 Tax=Papilio xuthus TaxID=66420 RepID=A0AAJ6ZS57_PAPXU|nr:PREDICTED: pre-mRNA-splicing factor ISY1 homolog [Papilio xuthus]
MARNAEKAMTTLARWRAAQVQEAGGQRERRPYLASECNDLPQAEKWRLQIVREIAKKVAQIQNAGLGEFRIRDLNDEINKLMREKRHWEVQIKSLGGPDHARVGPRMLDQDGKEVPGNRGYKYFGAAKDLPGVRELFEQEPPPPARRTRADLMRDVDADYYGYRDDDDGLLLPLEKNAEKHAIARAVEEWKRNKEQNKDQDLPEEENIYPEDPDDKRIEDDEEMPEKPPAPTLVAVPSQKDIEEALLRRKKQELLERYGCLDVKLENS